MWMANRKLAKNESETRFLAFIILKSASTAGSISQVHMQIVGEVTTKCLFSLMQLYSFTLSQHLCVVGLRGLLILLY